MGISERKFPRYDTDVTAKVRILGAPDWSDVRITNLSKGGACVESNVAFNELTEVEIIVNSPNPQIRIHNFMGRIVWTDGSRFGVQFLLRL